MIRSKYTVLYGDFPGPGKHLFFSTRTQATVVIDDELRELLASLPDGDVPKAVRPTVAKLVEMGFVVESEEEDRRIITKWFDAMKSDSSRILATVLTTYACNFACPYCVEGEVIAPISMSRDTAEAAVSYIGCRAMEHSAQEIFISFYGGEPLLNREAIRVVSAGLQEFAAENGIRFSFGMTTNGSLLTPKVVNELKPYGLRGVKVTIDGTREHHDRHRPFRNGKGSFDVILGNVLYASAHIDVDVGGNFDDENIESFPALLDLLKSLGLHERLHAVRFKPISETLKDRRGISHSADMGCVYSDPKVAGRMVDLRRLTAQKGFPVDRGVGVNLCSVVANDSQFTVDPEGKLHKCPALVGYREFEVGSIWEGEKRKLVSGDLWERCIDCPYVPLCGDGCVYGAYLRFGELERLNCQKEYVEYLVEQNLKTDYLKKRRTGS